MAHRPDAVDEVLPSSGGGPFKHDLPENRPASVFGGKVTLHAGPAHPSHVLLPVIPPKE